MRYLWTVLCLAPALLGQFAAGTWKTDTSKKSIDLRELRAGGPPKDGIPAIGRPKFVAASQATWLARGELVIAYAAGGQARAYPLQILMWHELVNDEISGQPILVSYCPLCNSAIVFDRRVNGDTLDFGVSGMLRNSDMVMYDHQTDSLWQQITGEAIVGTYTGRTLKMLSSQMISFEDFSHTYPDGVVLSRDTGFSRDYGRNPYQGYEFGNGPIMPVRRRTKPGVRPMDKLVVLSDGGRRYRAYTMKSLAQTGVTHDRLGGRPVAIFHSRAGLSPVDHADMSRSREVGSIGVFRAELDGQVLKFRRKNNSIEDRQTGSRWSLTGVAEEGALKGKRLEPVEHGVYFAFAWLAFQPDTVVVGAPAEEAEPLPGGRPASGPAALP